MKKEKIIKVRQIGVCPTCGASYPRTHRLVGGGHHCLLCGWDFDVPEGGRDLEGIGFIEE